MITNYISPLHSGYHFYNHHYRCGSLCSGLFHISIPEVSMRTPFFSLPYSLRLQSRCWALSFWDAVRFRDR